VRKPKPQEWIRVHPDKRQDCNFVVLDEGGKEYYLVHPNLHDALQNELVTCTLYVAINTAGVVFLWPAARASESWHRSSTWARSRHEAAAAAMLRRVRVQPNTSMQAYEIAYSDHPGPEPDPVWPDKSLQELADIAFRKTGRLIDSLDHPVIKYLRGLV
jgi:hypothetical protein